MSKELLTEHEELLLMRKILSNLSYAIIGYENKETTKLTEMMSEIKTYGYNLGNSWEGQEWEEWEELRIRSIKKLAE